MQPGERGGVVGGGPGAPGPGVVSGPQGQHRVPQVVGGVPPGGGGEGVVVGGPKTNALARLNRRMSGYRERRESLEDRYDRARGAYNAQAQGETAALAQKVVESTKTKKGSKKSSADKQKVKDAFNGGVANGFGGGIKRSRAASEDEKKEVKRPNLDVKREAPSPVVQAKNPEVKQEPKAEPSQPEVKEEVNKNESLEGLDDLKDFMGESLDDSNLNDLINDLPNDFIDNFDFDKGEMLEDLGNAVGAEFSGDGGGAPPSAVGRSNSQPVPGGDESSPAMPRANSFDGGRANSPKGSSSMEAAQRLKIMAQQHQQQLGGGPPPPMRGMAPQQQQQQNCRPNMAQQQQLHMGGGNPMYGMHMHNGMMPGGGGPRQMPPGMRPPHPMMGMQQMPPGPMMHPMGHPHHHMNGPHPAAMGGPSLPGGPRGGHPNPPQGGGGGGPGGGPGGAGAAQGGGRQGMPNLPTSPLPPAKATKGSKKKSKNNHSTANSSSGAMNSSSSQASLQQQRNQQQQQQEGYPPQQQQNQAPNMPGHPRQMAPGVMMPSRPDGAPVGGGFGPHQPGMGPADQVRLRAQQSSRYRLGNPRQQQGGSNAQMQQGMGNMQMPHQQMMNPAMRQVRRCWWFFVK